MNFNQIKITPKKLASVAQVVGAPRSLRSRVSQFQEQQTGEITFFCGSQNTVLTVHQSGRDQELFYENAHAEPLVVDSLCPHEKKNIPRYIAEKLIAACCEMKLSNAVELLHFDNRGFGYRFAATPYAKQALIGDRQQLIRSFTDTIEYIDVFVTPDGEAHFFLHGGAASWDEAILIAIALEIDEHVPRAGRFVGAVGADHANRLVLHKGPAGFDLGLNVQFSVAAPSHAPLRFIASA